MKTSISDLSSGPIRFFHICTDGTNNGVVHASEQDYQRAITISAINALKYSVKIICYCHMSSHSHFVVWCNTSIQAYSFANAYKRDYSRYMSLHNGISNVYRGIRCQVKEIGDNNYLKKCIAYTLLNPVVPKIVRFAEEYKWSSFSAYFNDSPIEGIPVSSLTVRKQRELLHTKVDLSQCNYKIDIDGHLVVRSFVDWKFVERLFGNKTAFFRQLDFTDSISEESKYVEHVINYDDTELIAEVITRARDKYRKDSLRLLTKQEKFSIARYVMKKTGAGSRRLARILRLKPAELSAIIGENISE